MIKWRKVKKDFKKRGRLKWISKEIIAMSKGGATYRSEIVDVKISLTKAKHIGYSFITKPIHDDLQKLTNMTPLGFHIDNNFIPY